MAIARSPTVHDALPRNMWRALQSTLPLNWDVERRYRLPVETMGPYYIDWRSDSSVFGEGWQQSPFDESGVILTPRLRVYHPVRIAQYGLHRHAEWLDSGATGAKRAFLAQARWLADNQSVRHGIPGCYPYDFANPRYGAERGWLSAMAQGEAVSLLLRANTTQPQAGFGEAALAAAEPFRHTVEEGGVVWRGPEGDVFLEEVAALPASHILNGHIYALWGLTELDRARTETWVGTLAADALRTLERRLPLYDAGFWSYYDLLATRRGFRPVALLKYHAFHIAQLRVTAAMTGTLYFGDVADRWRACARSWPCRVKVVSNLLAGIIARHVTKSASVPGGAVTLL